MTFKYETFLFALDIKELSKIMFLWLQISVSKFTGQ